MTEQVLIQIEMTNVIKNSEKQVFDLQVWFRRNNGEKDFENYRETASTLEAAVHQAESNHRFIVGTYHNGQKVSNNRVNLQP